MSLNQFPPKKLASDWLTSLVSQSEASFLAENSLTSYFHLKPKPTMPLVWLSSDNFMQFLNFDCSI